MEREALLREAAEWFERVHEAASFQNLLEWQAWLDAGAEHGHAFRSVERTWQLASVGAEFPTETGMAVDEYDGTLSISQWRQVGDPSARTPQGEGR